MLCSKTSKPTRTGKGQLKSPVVRSRPPEQFLDGSVRGRKRKRVWKACERCKIKKIKCDAGTPCRRCRDDGMICVTNLTRRTECVSVPQGYADVLESTHFSLVATIEKLYTMLRNGEKWLLDEPQRNEHGAPIVHDIAKLLRCSRGTQENFWTTPDIQEQGRRMLLPKQELMEARQNLSFSSDRFPAAHLTELECHSQDLEPNSSGMNQEKFVYPDHQEDCLILSLSQEYPLPTLEKPQEKQYTPLRVPIEDSNQHLCQVKSSWNLFPDSDISFNTINEPYKSASESSLGMLDLAMWSDELAWKSFIEP